jgi:predicted DNA-binding transcriptional regulator AlpA
LCDECYSRIAQRLKAIVRQHTPATHEDQGFVDAEAMARAALDPSVRVLALASEEKRRYYTQREAAAAAGIDSKTLYLWVRNGDVQPSIQITPKKSMWTDADVEELKLLKSKNASHHGSAASRARWSKKGESA